MLMTDWYDSYEARSFERNYSAHAEWQCIQNKDKDDKIARFLWSKEYKTLKFTRK